MDLLMVQWLTVSLLAGGALFGVFYKMQHGFGSFNLRVLGIVFIGGLATLLALHDSGSITPAMGILGTIVGYILSNKDNV